MNDDDLLNVSEEDLKKYEQAMKDPQQKVKILTQIKKVFEGFKFWKKSTTKKREVFEKTEQEVDQVRNSIKDL